MILLKKGKPPEMWWNGKEVECKECGTVMKLQSKDPVKPYGVFYAIKCPICNHLQPFADREVE